MEELTSRAQLENNVVVLFGLGEFDELDDIWVVELSHNLHFLEDVRSLQLITSVISLEVILGRKQSQGP